MFPWEHLQMCEWVAEGLKLTDTTEMPNAQNTEKEKHRHSQIAQPQTYTLPTFNASSRDIYNMVAVC